MPVYSLELLGVVALIYFLLPMLPDELTQGPLDARQRAGAALGIGFAMTGVEHCLLAPRYAARLAPGVSAKLPLVSISALIRGVTGLGMMTERFRTPRTEPYQLQRPRPADGIRLNEEDWIGHHLVNQFQGQ